MMKNVRDMSCAECFKYENNLYMRTTYGRNNWDGDSEYMCINLDTKETKFFNGWTQVETVNVKITIE